MTRVLLVAALAIGLCGCSSTGAPQQTAAATSCETMYSDQPSDAVARANCLNDVDMARARQTRNPKLMYAIIGKRSELAEQQAAGRITAAQAEQQLADFRSRIGGDEADRPRPSHRRKSAQQHGQGAEVLDDRHVQQRVQIREGLPLRTALPLSDRGPAEACDQAGLAAKP